MENVMYCPVCGFVACFPQWEICIECHATLIDSGKTLQQYYMELKTTIPEVVQEYIRKNFIYNKSDFSLEKENERLKSCEDLQIHIEQSKRDDQQKNLVQTVTPHCPHCGSNLPPQLMKKKWSLFTGFLTNKVERYCVNCGKKF